jgi:hypothetical protein
MAGKRLKEISYKVNFQYYRILIDENNIQIMELRRFLIPVNDEI